MINDEKIEAQLRNKGLNAKRLTPKHIDDAIKKVEYHLFENSQLTICCLTLKNGFNVIGESACVSPENFNKEIGEQIAFNNARNKIWTLEGYLLKQEIYNEENIKNN